MIQKLLHKLWKQEGHETLSTPKNMDAAFVLTYKELLIGVLSLNQGLWSFQYSEEFRNQTQLVPIPDFPDVNKVYKSKILYPFFLSRIPGLNQPKVKQILEKENIDHTNAAKLLQRFGAKSIANPFLLRAS